MVLLNKRVKVYQESEPNVAQLRRFMMIFQGMAKTLFIRDEAGAEFRVVEILHGNLIIDGESCCSSSGLA